MNTIYQDKLIEITDQEVVFHRYYFPFGGDKHVSLSHIESIQVRQPSFFGGVGGYGGLATFGLGFRWTVAGPVVTRYSSLPCAIVLVASDSQSTIRRK